MKKFKATMPKFMVAQYCDHKWGVIDKDDGLFLPFFYPTKSEAVEFKLLMLEVWKGLLAHWRKK